MWSNAIRRTGRSTFHVARRHVHSSSSAWRVAGRTTLRPLLPLPQQQQGVVRFLKTQDDSSDSEKTSSDTEKTTPEIVYNSILGGSVTRLRTVSLLTGVVGSIGLPLIIAFKGGDLPSTGMLAVALTFVAGSLGSTAAVYYVFSPYIFTIERIPIRKCHYPKAVMEGEEAPTDAETQENKKECKETLLKAISTSLFLTRTETVFDPATDVVPYKGLRPLCNFIAKGIPMYVHPEFVYDETLRRVLDLDKTPDEPEAKPLQKENPDDWF